MKMPKSGFVNEENMAEVTDWYEVTMGGAYFTNSYKDKLNFELFVRKLPERRSYLVSAGLEQAVYYLQNMKFSEDYIGWMKAQPEFENSDDGYFKGFFDYLRNFRFGADVWAVPEGSIVFQNEPILRVNGTAIEAQYIETYVLNTLHMQTTIASKASRVVDAAKGIPVIDFGLRRAHHILASRAAYIGGCNATSNVFVAKTFGIPKSGTMAHSFILASDSELDAFRNYAGVYPDNSVFLIDTYDIIEGAKNAIVVAKEMEKEGHKLKAVRIDSGDLLQIGRNVRGMLDEAGLNYVGIFVSGDLDEYKIDYLVKNNAPITGFGVGTKMDSSEDAPTINIIYKLDEIINSRQRIPKIKLSKDKLTLPKRMPLRIYGKDCSFEKDILALDDEKIEGAHPLLVKIMEKGELIYDMPSLDEIRKYHLGQISKLPEKYKSLENSVEYPVELSPGLEALTEKLIKEYKNGNNTNKGG
jgi:nicotinate phosphoribosyltransferase